MGLRLERLVRLVTSVRVSTALTLVLLVAVTLAFLIILTRAIWTPRDDPTAFPGYTLVAPLQSKDTYLIDMQGRVVRTWESDYTAGQTAYLLENGHLLRAGQIRRDEQLLAGAAAGGRVQEFTWEGELVWDFKFHNEKQIPHHDIARLPSGNVLLIVWELRTAGETIAAGRRPEAVDGPWLVDSVIEIKPTGTTTGEVVWEWHIWDHLIQDRDSSQANYGDVAAHPERIDINFGQTLFAELFGAGQSPQAEAKNQKDANRLRSIGYLGSPAPRGNPGITPDWTHVNAVAYNPELDQILLTVRAFSEFWIIDHSTTSAEAAGHAGGRSGKGGDLLYRWGNPQAYRAGTKADQRLFTPHDAHWIPPGRPGAGHVLVFNNGRGRPGGDYSTVDEFVLPVDARGRYVRASGPAYGPNGPVWRYAAPHQKYWSAGFMSGAQRLPNGNTLICDGVSGTIFEVTRGEEVVWKYTSSGAPRPALGGSGPPPGGFGGQTRPDEILAVVLRDMLRMSPEQKKELDAFQKEVDARLDKILTDEQKERLREVSSFGPGGFAGLALPGQIMSLSRQASLKPTGEQKTELTELQNQVDAKLDQVLTADQKAQFQKLKDAIIRHGPLRFGPGGPSGAGPVPPGGPRGFGPGGPGGFGGPPGGNPVFRAYRYGMDYAGLAGKDLRPGGSVRAR
jgi:hypothetical protein